MVAGGLAILLVVFGLVLMVAVAMVIGVVVTSAGKTSRQAPVLSADATVVTKRSDVISSGSTQHHVTFELTDGRRLEFAVAGEVAGQLVVQDTGSLMWQGTRFAGFQRQILR